MNGQRIETTRASLLCNINNRSVYVNCIIIRGFLLASTTVKIYTSVTEKRTGTTLYYLNVHELAS